MNDLGPDAMSILRTADGFDDPSPGDEERVRAKLSAQLGGGVGLGVAVLATAKTAGAATTVGAAGMVAGAGAGASSSLAPPAIVGGAAGTVGIVAGATSGVGIVGKISLGVVLLTALGGSAYAIKASRAPAGARDVSHASSATARTPDSIASSVVATPSAPPAPNSPSASIHVYSTSGALAPEPPTSTPVRTPSAAAPNAHIVNGEDPKDVDPLVSEIALMRDAQGALARGDSALALAKVAEHARKFPRGSLTQEREGTRVLALCAAGRTAEARTSGKAFLASYGRSPLAERVRNSCAVGATPSE